MPSRCCEFVDSRLRRSPPDRASAVTYGQAGENVMRFPHLAHRSAAAHKLHTTPQQHGMNLISGNDQTSSRLPAFSLSSPEAVQTTGTVAWRHAALSIFVAPSVDDGLAIDVGSKGHQAFPEFVFGADVDVAQHRTRQLGEEALNEIEP